MPPPKAKLPAADAPASPLLPRVAPLEGRPITARVDREGRYREVSAEYARLFALKPAALAGKPVRDVVGKKYWAAIAPYVERALRGEFVSFVETLRAMSGERIVEAHYVPDAGGFTALLFERTEQRRSEVAYQAIFAQAGEGIAETDLQGTLVRVNDRYCEIVGWPRSALVGRSLSELTHPEDPVTDEAAIRRLVKSGGRAYVEKRLLRPDDTPVWVTVSLSILRATDGQPVGAMGVVHDLTARRKALAALRLSEETHRAMGAASPVGLFVTDLGGALQHVNPRVEQIFGLPAEKILGRRWLDLIVPEDAAGVAESIRASREEGRENEMTFRVRRADGRVRWLSGKSAPMRDDAGAIIGYAGALEDATDARRVNGEREALLRELQDERKRLKDILDALPAVIWETRGASPDAFQLTYLSRYAETLTGVPVQEFLTEPGKGLTMVHPDDRARVGAVVKEALATGQAARYEYRTPERDGKVRWLAAYSRPILDRFGRAIGTRGVAMDITERREAEDAIRRGEEAQREFIANVSHDFRTPLASIRGYTETLLRGAHDNRAERLEFLGTILSNAQRLTELTEDILLVSSLESGAAQPEPEEVPLAGFASRLVEELGPTLRAASIKFRCSVPESLALMIDPGHLGQILQNLVSNATRYNKKGGWIELTAKRLPGGAPTPMAEVCVADGGIGIAAEHLPRVFDRFYRVDRVRSSAARASGLGLHIVKRLVESAGGRVRVESRPGRGSKFYFTAPLA